MREIDQESREHIVSITDLLDRFHHGTQHREELLWDYAKQEAIRNQVVHLVETLDDCVSRREQQMADLQGDVTTVQMRVHNEWVYVDKDFTHIEQTLIGLTHRMTIVQEISSNWNCIQSDLQNLNQEMSTVHELQTTLKDLLQNLVEHMENLAQGDDIHEDIGETMKRTKPGVGGGSQIGGNPSMTSMHLGLWTARGDVPSGPQSGCTSS